MKAPSPKMNEPALVDAARRGDRKALLRLLENNWDWLKGLLYSILGNPEDVDEALQNVCVLVIDKIHTVREPERFRGWLSTVARNAALALREKRAKKPITLDRLLAAQQPATRGNEIADQLDRQEMCRRILDAARLLPEKYREVFVMKYTKDMTYAEIGEILQLPITTVQIRLVRARRMIHNRLTGKPIDKVPRT